MKFLIVLYTVKADTMDTGSLKRWRSSRGMEGDSPMRQGQLSYRKGKHDHIAHPSLVTLSLMLPLEACLN